MSLNNQSGCLAALGRQARGAGRDRGSDHDLPAAGGRHGPDAFLPDLALSLNNQSPRLAELGRPDEALTAIEEAVTIRRALAEAQPDAFLPDLAMSLNNQSGCLAGLGRWAAALTAIEEAILSGAPWPRPSPTRSCPTSPCHSRTSPPYCRPPGKNAEAEAARTEAAIRDRA